MRLRQIRNATLVIDFAGRRLLVDPWLERSGEGVLAKSPWSERNVPSPLVDLPCSPEEVLHGVDAMVVTHVHPDHFERHTSALLDPALPVYVQDEADFETVASWGHTDVRVISDAGTSYGVGLREASSLVPMRPWPRCAPRRRTAGRR